MTRRPLSDYKARPRLFERAVEDWNERELARYERQVDLADAEAEELDAEHDPDYRDWLADE